MNPLSKSLSLRLLGIFIVTAIIALLVLSQLFSTGLRSQWQRSIRPHLDRYLSYVQADLGTPPSEERARQLAAELPVHIHVFLDERAVFTTRESTLDLNELNYERRWRSRSRHGNEASHDKPTDTASTWRRPPLHDIAFAEHSNRAILRAVQGDYTVYYEFDRYRGRGRDLDHLLYALMALALILGLCFAVLRWQLLPIRRIQRGVQRMGDGELDHRLQLKGNDDLAQLGNSIDGMASQIQQMLDAKRQLLLAISHELRSPITRARVATEMLQESVNRDRIMEDLESMERMIQGIMESERLQQSHATLNRSLFNLSTLIREIARPFSHGDQTQSLSHGEASSGALTHETPDTARLSIVLPEQPVMIHADEQRLRILLRNLLENACQHGRARADATAVVSISLDVSDSTTTSEPAIISIIVSDEGPGIPAEHQARVTDAFYRPDASRTRATGGFGLGLTLCRLIAEAHGGQLTISDNPTASTGTQVRITLRASGEGDQSPAAEID